MKETVRFELNGSEVMVDVEGSTSLLAVLRDQLGVTGPKEGCGNGECGACTVLLDGQAVNGCILPAAEVEGRHVTTIEGLMTDRAPGTVQRAFLEAGAIQCGFCTPGMVLSVHALLNENPTPSGSEIRHALRGNLCRCTGYVQIVEAVHKAIEQVKGVRE